MALQRVVVIGGTGFIGTHVANRLSAEGIQTVIPTRRRGRVKNLLLLPTAHVVEANIHDPSKLIPLLKNADAVINLVGILHSSPGDPYGADFAEAHVELPQKIAEACATHKIPHLIHISALGASAEAPSGYQRSKAAGEQAIQTHCGETAWTILRPSVVFGPDDRFINMFAQLASIFPILPLACTTTRFQPVYVEDLCETIWQCLQRSDAKNHIFDVAGPRTYTLKQLVAYACRQSGHPRKIIDLPENIAMLQARLMEFMPVPLMSRDNVLSMRQDNITSKNPLPFNLVPRSLEAIVPTYLGQDCLQKKFFSMRAKARRNRA